MNIQKLKNLSIQHSASETTKKNELKIPQNSFDIVAPILPEYPTKSLQIERLQTSDSISSSIFDENKLDQAQKILTQNHARLLSLRLPKLIPTHLQHAYICLAQSIQAANMGDLEAMQQQWHLLESSEAIPHLDYQDVRTTLYQIVHDFYFSMAEKASTTKEWSILALCFGQAEKCMEACSDLEPKKLNQVRNIWEISHTSARRYFVLSAFSSAMHGSIRDTRSFLKKAQKENAHDEIQKYPIGIKHFSPFYIFQTESNPQLTRFIKDPDLIASEFSLFSELLIKQSTIVAISKVSENCLTKLNSFKSILQNLNNIFHKSTHQNSSNDNKISENLYDLFTSTELTPEDIDLFCPQINQTTSPISEEKILNFIAAHCSNPFTYATDKNKYNIQKLLKYDIKEIMPKDTQESDSDEENSSIEIPEALKKQVALSLPTLIKHGTSYESIKYIIQQLIRNDIEIHESLKDAYTGPQKNNIQPEWLTSHILSLFNHPSAGKILQKLSENRFVSDFDITTYTKIIDSNSDAHYLIEQLHNTFYSYQSKIIQSALRSINRLDPSNTEASRITSVQILRKYHVEIISNKIQYFQHNIETIIKSDAISDSILRELSSNIDQAFTYLGMLYNHIQNEHDNIFYNQHILSLKNLHQKFIQLKRTYENLNTPQTKGASSGSLISKSVRFDADTSINYFSCPSPSPSIESTEESIESIDEDIASLTQKQEQALQNANKYAIQGDLEKVFEETEAAQSYANALESTLDSRRLKVIMQTAYQSITHDLLENAVTSAKDGNIELTYEYLKIIPFYAHITKQKRIDTTPIVKYAYMVVVFRYLSMIESYQKENLSITETEKLNNLKSQIINYAEHCTTPNIHKQLQSFIID